ncbi:hypothetical protein MVLG_03951 [Microbotryum lychnidis-dioicae p1A1 Lamole]|uniref:Uncharacterized protein n=1 Tax=Microbotryum lychnidis-dioicae (strain p1A1 Lamole / MvSl-1064) TaxID=683840 RepID=U5H9R2_USTV1|nr:hypothetical protein MVLG_03951 [Microbotryum lychnidis-dioicae p1A1 Lamole]|eukprot:KDE05717.1 hypothetical protein MVLG_03951 [Microbotryum lychnidis-dioicae p1A1 Lamole]
MSKALTIDLLARMSEREAKVESIMADHTARMDKWSQKVGPSKERDDDERVKRLADQKLIELIPFLKDNHPDAYYAFLNRNKDESEEDTSILETPTKAVKQIVEMSEHPAVLAGISNIAGEIPTDSALRRQGYNTRETRGEKSHLDTILEAARANNPSPEDPDDDGSDDGSEKSNGNAGADHR